MTPYTLDYEAMDVKIVDAAVLYECLFTHEQSIIFMRNALHVPSMDNNLIPHFIMREAGIDVINVPKFQCDDPSLDDHALVMANKTILPLLLIVVFSYFPTSRPTEADLKTVESIFTITPENWNPHSDMFQNNESCMLDWQVNLVDAKYRKTILLADVQEDKSMAAALCVGSIKMKTID